MSVTFVRKLNNEIRLLLEKYVRYVPKCVNIVLRNAVSIKLSIASNVQRLAIIVAVSAVKWQLNPENSA